MPPKKNKVDTLNVLYKRRTLLSDRVRKFETFLAEISSSNSTPGEIRARLSKIKETWSDFDTIQTEIEISIEDETRLEIEGAYRDEFESRYYHIVGQGDDLLEKLGGTGGPTRNSNSPLNLGSAADVKLPPITLPTFAGDFDEWISFYTMFKELVHENRLYQEPIKLKYLKNSLRGEAYALVESLELIAQNYEVALQLLKDRYDNPTRAILKHTRCLFDLPKIEKRNSSTIRSLLDGSQKHIRSLKSLDQPTEKWDTLLVHLISTKLDPFTFREWQNVIPSKELPTFKSLIEFLEHQCHVLEAVASQNFSRPGNATKFEPQKSRSLVVATPSKGCVLCTGAHSLDSCEQFHTMSVADRFAFVKDNKFCIGCLKGPHRVAGCRGSVTCEFCQKNHHSLLHRVVHPPDLNALVETAATDMQSPNSPLSSAASGCSLHSAVVSKPSVVMLSTASVVVHSPNGQQLTCRALLDCGSQSSFMNSSVCDKLGLKKSNIRMAVHGFSSSSHAVGSRAEAKISSLASNFTRSVDFLVVPKITEYVPQFNFDVPSLPLPPHVVLADTGFQSHKEIDILIGADIFWDVLCQGEVELSMFSIGLRETKFGWIFTGKTTVALTTHCHLLAHVTLESLDASIRKFWEIENIPRSATSIHLSAEEEKCEALYRSTTRRDDNGRYIVQLPLLNDPKLLGDSKEAAVRRFYGLEKRFARNPDLKVQYKKFIDQYIELGHMKEVEPGELENFRNVYYVPHHPVFKQSSSTTKIRVVFDFSNKTTSGYSLNDICMVGPNIQPSLYSHLIRARTYPILVNGDLEKMYRQIKIDPSQVVLQLIVWRESPDKPLGVYKLLTVSYGNASAAWLSTRTLEQTAQDHPNPFTSKVIREEFYVDDCFTGTNTVEEAKRLRIELSHHLSLAGFKIRKWNSNSLEFMESVPEEDREMQLPVSLNEDSSFVRTLGLQWLPVEDCFTFSFDEVQFNGEQDTPTKRHLYSSISKLYDPLGLIGPVITRAKILMQDLWRMDYDWDEPISSSLAKKWSIFGRSLLSLKKLKFPRRLTVDGVSQMELHGFADASTVTYGACLYLRTIDKDGNVTSQLVTSKSRVAPIKTQTLPRLELLAALLLAELTKHAMESLKNIHIDQITYWTDSRVTLSWICGSPSNWKTFVANKVSQIQDLSHPTQWKHVSSRFNPADLISRGLYADQLVKNDLWLHGPCWLIEKGDIGNMGTFEQIQDSDLPDFRTPKINSMVAAVDRSHLINTIGKLSSFDRLIRVIAYCLRFLRRCHKPKGERPNGPISTAEFHESKLAILRIAQQSMFPQEYDDLRSGKSIHRSSPLSSLKCFMARRGKPHTIYCDNATNFVGAKRELDELKRLWLSQVHKDAIVNFAAKDCINWKFIPPRSPNFGGLWESGVKMIKTHLKRILGKHDLLTFNEMYTLLTQIEACVNSRPLFPLSSDPNDLASLTPAHFLIGSCLTAPPEPRLMSEPSNRLSRWQLVQCCTQHFWSRWTSEYLSELQRRMKWKINSGNLAVGTLVLIKNDQAPPTSWAIGRIVNVHPGTDGLVRVATIKTSSGLYRRNVRLLCPLPMEEHLDLKMQDLQGGEIMDKMA